MTSARRQAERERDRLLSVRDELRAAGFDPDANRYEVRNAVGREPLLSALREVRALTDRIAGIVEREVATVERYAKVGPA